MPSPIITALPASPSRADPANFAARGDALLGALPAFVTQANALAVDLTAKAATADSQGAAAVQAASVASNARDAALNYRDVANGAAQTAVTKAGEAAGSAGAAAASAASASAVSGIPAIAGKQLYSLRVNAAGNALEWVLSGDALGFVPVQQGGGVGQLTNKIYIGYGAGGGGVRVTVDSSDFGYIPMSTTNPDGTTITFVRNVVAPTFNGTHYGNAANLTGLTASQINTALTYAPLNAAFCAPGAVLEVGAAVDFHGATGANSYDARVSCGAPSGGDGTSILEIYAALLKVHGGGVDAPYFAGNGQFLTGFTLAQITGALGFTPASNTSAVLTGTAGDVGAASATGSAVVVNGAGGSNSAFLTLLRPGFYGINFGIASDNTVALGGYSQGLNTFRFLSDAIGNFTALGNLTSTSDIRFKTELQRLTNVAKRLCAIDKGGMRYLDTRTGEHKYGVSAQGVQKHFPDAVVMDERGHLSVAYGQLALAALIEVTREFQAKFDKQERRLSRLEERM